MDAAEKVGNLVYQELANENEVCNYCGKCPDSWSLGPIWAPCITTDL